MTTTSTTSATGSLPTGTQFAGDEFSNNLFSDLAPLLTLFGEQVTKQFLSMSMGWADNILLAVGPLGIITAVVSAIRVGGARRLKAIIGRARESPADAEQELLSSTSSEVCELWGGREIVRIAGQPGNMKDLVITKRNDGVTSVLDIHEAYNSGLLVVDKSFRDDEDAKLDETAMAAPNIGLNVQGSLPNALELWFWVAVGTLLQLLALALPAVSTYHWKWPKGNAPVPRYGYPCFAYGSFLIIVGMILCGHVIEGSTTEYVFEPKVNAHKEIQQVLRLQNACTVSDKHFSSFVILNDRKNLRLWTSRLNGKVYSSLSIIATFITVTGFVIQFVGLRALHWSATILLLGITLIMTCVRAWVRRGLANDPICIPVPESNGLAWLAVRITQNDWHLFTKQRGLNRPTNNKDWWQGILPNTLKTSRDIGNGTIRGHALNTSRDCDWGLLMGCTLSYWKHQGVQGGSVLVLDITANIHEPLDDLWNMTQFAEQLHLLAGQEFVLGFAAPDIHSPLNPLLWAYEQLQRQTSKAEANTELISKLSTALEGILSILSSSPHVLWRYDQVPWAKGGACNWEIDLQASLGRKARWIIPFRSRKDSNTHGGKIWSLEKTDLTAGLSIWLYSLECGVRSLDAFCSNIASNIPSSGRGGALTGLEWRNHAYCLRVIGSGNGPRRERAYRLREWISTMPISSLPPYGSDLDTAIESAFDYTTAHWPIFGLYYSSFFEMRDLPLKNQRPRQGESMKTAPRISAQKAFCFSRPDPVKVSRVVPCEPGIDPEEYGPSRRGAGPSRDSLFDIATLCKLDIGSTSLASEGVREIISLFMLSVAAAVERVGGTTEIRASSASSRRMKRGGRQVITNSLFTSLAQQIVNAGLAKNIDDALILIVPAFDKFDLLPNEGDPEIPVREEKGERNETGAERHTGRDI